VNFDAIALGALSFLIIGLLHPVVIYAEYFIGKKCWPAFLVSGTACLAACLFAGSFFGAALLSILGFSLLWSIKEVREQEERVKKGWFAENPNPKWGEKKKKANQEGL